MVKFLWKPKSISKPLFSTSAIFSDGKDKGYDEGFLDGINSNNYVNNFVPNNIKFFVVAILDLILGIILFNYILINNIFTWFIVSIIFTLVNSIIILVIYKMFGETKFFNRFKFLLKRS